MTVYCMDPQSMDPPVYTFFFLQSLEWVESKQRVMQQVLWIQKGTGIGKGNNKSG